MKRKKYIPKTLYTIEKHLQSFQVNPDCEFICASWLVEKPQYINRLKAVPMRYPHFSSHDASHSEEILRNIERVLGAKRIKQLSPTDAWLILQCAYTHDMAMAMSAEKLILKLEANYHEIEQKLLTLRKEDDDIEEAWAFINSVLKFDKGEYSFGSNVTEFITGLWDEGSIISNRVNRQMKKTLDKDWYEWSVYLSEKFAVITQALLRADHGKDISLVLNDDAEEKTYHGIIQRWFRQLILKIGSLHTSNFSDILKLPQRVNGLCGDTAHPRFIAVMLRLGDLLDLDSNRFNQAQIDVIGNNYYNSFLHQVKHKAVTSFYVCPYNIEICADIKTDFIRSWVNRVYSNSPYVINNMDYVINRIAIRSLKEFRNWIDWIESETKNISIYWLDIVPGGFTGSCPRLATESCQLYLDGERINIDSLNLNYEISSKRATEIIEGSSLYREPQLVFIRELLQNASDATIRQMFRDYKNQKSQNNVSNEIYPWSNYTYNGDDISNYRIDIIFGCDECKSFKFIIRDYGIGISEETLKKMKFIGTMHLIDFDIENKNMPGHLRPTGSFGVGMQSVFRLANEFDVWTRTRENNQYNNDGSLRKMRFCSSRFDGNILTYDIENDKNELAKYGYGTQITIEINEEDIHSFLSCLEKNNFLGKHYDIFANPIEILNDAIRRYIAKIYSNDLIPLYITDKTQKNPTTERICEIDFGKNIIFIDQKANDNSRWCSIGYIEGNSNSNTSGKFTCFNPKAGVMICYIDYKRKNSNYSDVWGDVSVYYKNITVNDKRLLDLIRIPFFNMQIYLFFDKTEEFIEINRDDFLKEKLHNIAARIRLTHLAGMEILLRNIGENKFYEMIQVKSEDNVESTYWQTIMKYTLYMVNCQANNKILLSFDNQINVSEECIPFYARVPEKNSILLYTSKSYVEDDPVIRYMVEGKNEILWFNDSLKFNRHMETVDYFGNGEAKIDVSPTWDIIAKDYFSCFPEISIHRIIFIQLQVGNEEIAKGDYGHHMIYRLGARNGEAVKMNKKDYWKYIFAELTKFKEETERAKEKKNEEENVNEKSCNDYRLILPGIGTNPVVEVYSIPTINGISDINLRYNRYFIAPLSMRELANFLSDNSEKDSILDDYVKLIEKNSLLLKHIIKYSCKKLKSNPYSQIDEKLIVSCYKKWLMELSNEYRCMD